MNDVMISYNAGQLHGYLNGEAMARLVKAIQGSKDYDDIAEPYKTWLKDKSAIKEKDMSKSALLAKRQRA